MKRNSSSIAMAGLVISTVLCSWGPGVRSAERNPYTGTSPLVVPAAAFHDDAGSSDYFFSFAGGYFGSPSSGTGCFRAPVQLPDGVGISRFRAHLFDNNAGADLTLRLYRKENSSTVSSQVLASVATTGQSTQVVTLEDTTILEPLVSHDFSYFVAGCWTGTSQRILGVEIHYSVTLGDFVWLDSDGNGLQDFETGVPDVLVALYDAGGALLATTQTDENGAYSFDELTLGATYKLRFWPPVGFSLTLPDQGTDDSLDSDADPATGETPSLVLSLAEQGYWDAGLVPSCPGPDETVYISRVGLTDDGNDYPLLTFQDPNQPVTVTGYNIYRSSSADLPPETWSLVASDIIDMDEGMPNKQWIDSSGDVSPTGIWYYDVAAYNHRCPVEGPR